MHSLHAKFLRTAQHIHAALVRQAGQFDRIQLPDHQWCRLQRIVRTAELARSRGWHAAARRREQQLLREINDLESALTRLTDQLQSALRRRPLRPRPSCIETSWPCRVISGMSSVIRTNTCYR